MAIFDLLGRRWAMGIVWQLAAGPLTFSELQQRCASISPTILSTRIKDLSEAKIVGKTLDGYQLTALGNELYSILEPFKDWAILWSKELE
ncbi:helix-turn-helix domain-containing protein [Pseudaeromonas sp. ZJS20]|uniref:winged helix-turn-helix transcriptional regulator n=1 Tax=Pseudaeromonas aegiceratis TaxID=3153928 RepID=UPI00390CBE4A